LITSRRRALCSKYFAVLWLAGVPLCAAPSFYKDVLPILQDHCQACHRTGAIAPMPLVSYQDARKWSAEIARRTTAREMPPWFADPKIGHFSNDPSLTSAQITMLTDWVQAGSPAGNSADAPAPRKWTAGFVIPQPDLVVTMPKPVAIPAHGNIDYTYEIVHTGFTEDRWVRMSEIRPSSREHVHHAVVYVRPPESTWLAGKPVGAPFTADSMTTSDILLVYAPGSSPDKWPDGMAKLVPRGSDLVFQMHYTANGKAAMDQTSIGMIFAKQRPAKRVMTLQLTNSHFRIPPGDPSYRVEVRGTIPNDALLLSFFPHLHLRGKEFEYNLISPPDSHDEMPPSIVPLLRVNYNFYWQLSYRLAEPRFLKAGTELQAVAIFDNSRKNPHNPDPDAEVVWGDQTRDEMMVGFFDVAVDPDVDKARFFERLKPADQ
jgi:hypothetical protein